jgi:hypothetical protein
MARDVDPKRTRKALRKVRKLAESSPADGFSGWEADFLKEVGERLETYGSAFRDTTKGRPEEALSTLQHHKLAEIAAKANGKPKKPMGWRKREQARSKSSSSEPGETDD